VTVWQQTASGIRLRVRVQPRASQNRIVGLHGDAVKVQVTAPPVEGAANEAVRELVAAWLDVPRRTVTLVQGQTGRNKVIEIAAEAPAKLAARLEAALVKL